MSEWFALIHDKVSGPLAFEQMRQLARAGEIRPGTLVRSVVDGSWVDATSVRGLVEGTSTPSGRDDVASWPPEKYRIRRRMKPNRLTAAFFALLFGNIGLHKFYLGYNQAGFMMILLSTVGVFMIIPPFIVFGIAMFEGFKYLFCSDQQFEATYLLEEREWL